MKSDTVFSLLKAAAFINSKVFRCAYLDMFISLLTFHYILKRYWKKNKNRLYFVVTVNKIKKVQIIMSSASLPMSSR